MSLIWLLVVILVFCLIGWLIAHFILPLLPAPWRTIVTVILVIIAILILLNFIGVFSGGIRVGG